MVTWFPERRCAICGRPFYPPVLEEWRYRKPRYPKSTSSALIYFCSWGCMRKYENGVEIRPGYKVVER